MLSALKTLFSPSPLREQAHDAYVLLVRQSRQPFFYKEYEVPDTVDGRFDVMALHLFMVIHRLRSETEKEAGEFIRALTEVFFADMDRSLREMGVGDTGISRRIKNMAQAFYGRLTVYEQSFTDPDKLAESLTRNLYRGTEKSPEIILAVIAYMQRTVTALSQQPAEAILSGRLNFLDGNF
jgi:cytochrome b pre-mRNA-processing protein 3